MRKTEQASSSSSLVVNLHTPRQEALAEKLKAQKEKFQRCVFILLALTVLDLWLLFRATKQHNFFHNLHLLLLVRKICYVTKFLNLLLKII